METAVAERRGRLSLGWDVREGYLEVVIFKLDFEG